jgi:hypothetical protein
VKDVEAFETAASRGLLPAVVEVEWVTEIKPQGVTVSRDADEICDLQRARERGVRDELGNLDANAFGLDVDLESHAVLTPRKPRSRG